MSTHFAGKGLWDNLLFFSFYHMGGDIYIYHFTIWMILITPGFCLLFRVSDRR